MTRLAGKPNNVKRWRLRAGVAFLLALALPFLLVLFAAVLVALVTLAFFICLSLCLTGQHGAERGVIVYALPKGLLASAIRTAASVTRRYLPATLRLRSLRVSACAPSQFAASVTPFLRARGPLTCALWQHDLSRSAPSAAAIPALAL